MRGGSSTHTSRSAGCAYEYCALHTCVDKKREGGVLAEIVYA